MLDKIKFTVNGHVKIEGKQTGEIFKDEDNAIHPEHFALVFARALANQSYWNLHSLVFGNGGSFADSTGKIIYNATNTTGNASLYNQTWEEVLDAASSNGNSVIAVANNDLTSSVIVTAILAAAEPNSQYGSDTADGNTLPNPATAGYSFDFDEMGLTVRNPLYVVGSTLQPEFLLLTHLVMSPIQKNANRELLITYTLTIAVS